MAEIVSEGTEFTQQGLQQVLWRLVEQGRIESKRIAGAAYYIHSTPVEFPRPF